MKTINKTAIVPKYLKNFKCTASSCELSCCITWRIVIDKLTYNKYASIDPKYSENLSLIDKESSDINYALINHVKDRCSYLTDSGLCTIHKEHDESYLSNTCRIFPRTVNSINSTLEISLVSSCPEAVKISLMNPLPMEFEQANYPLYPNTVLEKIIKTDTCISPIKKYFIIIRSTCICILQLRKFDLPSRIILLGSYIENVNKLELEKNTGNIPSLSENFISYLNNANLDNFLHGLKNDAKFKLDVFKEVLKMRNCVPNKKSLFTYKYYDKANKILNDMTEDPIARYNRLSKKFFNSFFLENQHILENFLVNFIFEKTFPFTLNDDLKYNYIYLAVIYSILETYILIMSEDEETPINIINLIPLFTRDYLHDISFAKRILDFLTQNDLISINNISLILKNDSV